jgi:two-component system sensor histidine kinase/response regulator
MPYNRKLNYDMLKDILLYFKLKWNWLVGNPENFTLESRIFHAFCVFAIITNCIETAINLLNSQEASILITAFLAIVQVGCYYMSRFKNKGKLAIIITAVEVNLATAIGYFYNSGLTGSTLLIFVIVLFILLLIVQPRQWLFWYSVNLLVVMSLVIWEFYHPEIIQHYYENRKAMFIDIGFSYVMVATLIFVCTIQMRKRYNLQLLLTEEKAFNLQLLHNEKDKLFSIISHDLNAPLAAIKQYLDLLNDVELEQAERVFIEKSLVKSVGSTQDLLHNLLQWSNSQMKKVAVDLQEVNLEEVLRSTINTFYQIALNKEINLATDVDSSIFVTADINMLQLIIRNLINNAIKFTPPKGKIWIKALIENDCCVLTVVDNGVGIPIEKQSKIFSLDIQSTAGTTLETGSGLGLVLVKEYTVMQQGKIWFKSEPGQGTTFYVSFPGRQMEVSVS